MPAHTVYDHVCSLLGPTCHRPVQVVPTRSYPGQLWRGVVVVVVVVVEGLSSRNTLALRNPLSALTPKPSGALLTGETRFPTLFYTKQREHWLPTLFNSDCAPYTPDLIFRRILVTSDLHSRDFLRL
jgi:hypothetical protein